jgi:hypothetical protein
MQDHHKPYNNPKLNHLKKKSIEIKKQKQKQNQNGT